MRQIAPTRYPRICYEKLLALYRADNTNTFNWFAQVKIMIEPSGFSESWINTNKCLSESDIKNILIGYKSFWLNSDKTSLRQSSALQILPQLPLTLDTSTYLRLLVPLRNLRIFSQIRFLNNFNSRIICKETRKFCPDDYCPYCSLPEQENFFHFLCVCRIYDELKSRYFGRSSIPLDYWLEILNCDSSGLLIKFTNYINAAFSLRQNFNSF